MRDIPKKRVRQCNPDIEQCLLFNVTPVEPPTASRDSHSWLDSLTVQHNRRRAVQSQICRYAWLVAADRRATRLLAEWSGKLGSCWFSVVVKLDVHVAHVMGYCEQFPSRW